ncbi:MAG: DUF3179 domain-containing protein, partial [Acidobacteria bacterium]|nr:DUF3179 domain-containing protein [Acidobacteriota bacterium]
MASKKLFIGFAILAVAVLAVAALRLAESPAALDSPSQPETGWDQRTHRFAVDRSDYTNTRPDEERYNFPLNINVEHVSAADAPLEDGELVLGVIINDEVRAYPVNYMMGPANEIVNDTLG